MLKKLKAGVLVDDIIITLQTPVTWELIVLTT